MKPAPFGYLRAGSVEEVTAALNEHGAEARILAGGKRIADAEITFRIMPFPAEALREAMTATARRIGLPAYG